MTMMTTIDDLRAAALRDADGWQDKRDAIVRAAVATLTGGLSFLDVQGALAAAFAEAARQEAETHGCGLAWASLARTAARMEAP